MGCGRRERIWQSWVPGWQKTSASFSNALLSSVPPALFPCTAFGFEAAAAKLGPGLEILTLKPLAFLGLWV